VTELVEGGNEIYVN
jgi:ubiquitin-protein ligase E3 A